MADVRLENIYKTYANGFQAVKDVSLSIKDGEFLVLVGPSGCGKSTTLNMIAGLDDISSGKLWIGKTLVNDVPAKNRDIAMVFQNYALYPHMSVYKNMAFGLKLRGLPKQEIKLRVEQAAQLLGIQGLLERLPKELSGGQRQRVAVGRAIVRQPAVFLFDEPLSNLDAKLRVQMRVELIELHKRLQATMIYVTHDQTEAMTMGDRIVVMKDGAIQQIDTPMNLYLKPINRFVASFIGMPPMNFFEGQVQKTERGYSFAQQDGFRLDLSERFLPTLAPREGRSITLGIRPEGIGSARAQMVAGSPKLKGRVRVIEPLGAESFVHLDLGQTSAIARLDDTCTVPMGDSLELPVLEDKIYFFDSRTEAAIPC
ncbi:MAG: ABC transporter ATP-binding protein [Oligoflexus sp.]